MCFFSGQRIIPEYSCGWYSRYCWRVPLTQSYCHSLVLGLSNFKIPDYGHFEIIFVSTLGIEFRVRWLDKVCIFEGRSHFHLWAIFFPRLYLKLVVDLAKYFQWLTCEKIQAHLSRFEWNVFKLSVFTVPFLWSCILNADPAIPYCGSIALLLIEFAP